MEDRYQKAHTAVFRAHGKAAEYLCLECDKPAQQWALTALDSDAKETDNRGQTFSTSVEDYDPLCVKCHLKRDGNSWSNRDLASNAGKKSVAAGGGFTRQWEENREQMLVRTRAGAVRQWEENREQMLVYQKAASKKGGHVTNHVNRGVVKDDCEWCTDSQ